MTESRSRQNSRSKSGDCRGPKIQSLNRETSHSPMQDLVEQKMKKKIHQIPQISKNALLNQALRARTNIVLAEIAVLPNDYSTHNWSTRHKRQKMIAEKTGQWFRVPKPGKRTRFPFRKNNHSHEALLKLWVGEGMILIKRRRKDTQSHLAR